MNGNLILIFNFILFVNIFSAAQDCTRPPPDFNLGKIRQCCKLPPIEGRMSKITYDHCKDLLQTLSNTKKPLRNPSSSNVEGSQSTQQGLPLQSESQQGPPTTQLNNPTTTIAAITTVLPMIMQSQQSGTSQESQQPDQQQKPSQTSANPGHQQGIQPTKQHQGQGQTSQQNGHKKPLSKLPTVYTTSFMCAMECVMNQLQIVNNGKYNNDNANNFLQNVLKNDDFTPVLQKVMPDCIEKTSEKVKKFVTTYNYTGCNSFGGLYLRCLNQEAANNCPDNKWLQTTNCNNLQSFITTCGPPK